MGILTRIRERKVIQWNLAYIGVAWLVLQVLDVVTQPWDLPTWIIQLAQILLLAGVPCVTILSWYHGKPGTQRVRAAEVALIAAVVVLGAFAAYASVEKATPNVAEATFDLPPPRNLYFGSADSLLRADFVVITSPEDLASMWRESLGAKAAGVAAPTVNFAEQMVIFVAAGAMRRGGIIFVDSVVLLRSVKPGIGVKRRELELAVVVVVELSCDDPHIVYPFQFAVVPRFNGGVKRVLKYQVAPESQYGRDVPLECFRPNS